MIANAPQPNRRIKIFLIEAPRSPVSFFVGWVERSETQQGICEVLLSKNGFWDLRSSYITQIGGTPIFIVVKKYLLCHNNP